MLISWMTFVMLNHRSLLKSGQILVRLNSSFLPFFASLQSPSLSEGQFREQTHVGNLQLALFRSHSPSLLLGNPALSDLRRKNSGPLSWRPCLYQRKQHYLFQQVWSLSKHLHLQRQWSVWPRRTGRNSLIYATWFGAARLQNGTAQTFLLLPGENSRWTHHGLQQQPHQEFWDKRFCFACILILEARKRSLIMHSVLGGYRNASWKLLYYM